MTRYYITQTAIHLGREYKPLYLADPHPTPPIWSGDPKHTYYFDSQAEAERMMLTFHINRDYVYIITATSDKNLIEWRRTLP